MSAMVPVLSMEMDIMSLLMGKGTTSMETVNMFSSRYVRVI